MNGNSFSRSTLQLVLLSALLLCSHPCNCQVRTLRPAPFAVGEIEPLWPATSTSTNTSSANATAFAIRIPWAITTILGDYYHAAGFDEFWKQRLKLSSNANDESVTQKAEDYSERQAPFPVVSLEGGHWMLGGGAAKDEDSNDSTSTTVCGGSDLQYIFANDQDTHSRLLSLLAHGDFDLVLDSLGKFLDVSDDGITIYSMGFMGATYAHAADPSTVLQSHLLTNNDATSKPTSFQLLIPVYLKHGSRPEIQIQGEQQQSTADDGSTLPSYLGIKQDLDIAMVLGDTVDYRTGTFDYRDSPGDAFMAFSIFFWVDTSNKLSTTSSTHKLPSFAANWLQQPQNAPFHWKKGDSASRLLDQAKTLYPMQQQSCGAADLNEEGVCTQQPDASSSQSPPEQQDRLFFWSTRDVYNWSHWTFRQFKSNLECEQFYDEANVSSKQKRRQPPTLEIWRKLRAIYTAIVGHDHSTLSPDPEQDSFLVPVTAKTSTPSRGRGVFANEFIPQGTLIYTPHQQARFSNGQQYKLFVMSASVDMACDLLAWSSIQKVVINGTEQPPQMVVDLDDGALVNTGARPNSTAAEEEDEIANVGCIKDLAINTSGGCSENDYALVDIQPGEELLIDYEEYSIYDRDVWMSFGLGDPNAGDDGDTGDDTDDSGDPDDESEGDEEEEEDGDDADGDDNEDGGDTDTDAGLDDRYQ